jgi:hypothetical protein
MNNDDNLTKTEKIKKEKEKMKIERYVKLLTTKTVIKSQDLEINDRLII